MATGSTERTDSVLSTAERSREEGREARSAEQVFSSTRFGGRAALAAFSAYVAAAFPLILLSLGRYHWFFGDEWSFLAERDATDLGDLFRSHGEHWTTIPILSYRALFSVFGLRSYLPYQGVLLLAHLTTAVLLRVIMRRAGVTPWTATIVASVFVLFGPGEENIVWAFQITFVGAVMFGLVDLILSDHDGSIDRRDWVGLLAGAASLMCSGIGLVMVAVVAFATLLRRGFRIAAFHTVPLAALYATWFLVTRPGGIDNPFGRGANTRELARFVWSGVRGTFEAIGAFRPIAVLLGALLLIGLPLSWGRHTLRRLRRAPAPIALLAAGLGFLVATGYTRWFVTPTAESQSRYLYTLAAFVLPALAVAADAVARRWRFATPVVLALFVVGIVANVDDFGSRDPFNETYHRQQRELVLSLAHAEEAHSVPAYVRPNPWFSIGWLRGAAAEGDAPEPPGPSEAVARQIPLLLGVAHLDDQPPNTECETLGRGIGLEPAKGDRFGFRFDSEPAEGSNWFLQNTVVVTRLGSNGELVGSVAFKSDFGRVLEIELDGLRLHLRAADPEQRLVLCR